MATTVRNEVTSWVGWVYFAAFLLMISGFLQIISGFTALFNDDFFLKTQSTLVVFDLTTWGWIHLIYGIIVLACGLSLINGATWARAGAVILASLNFLLQFTFLSTYPLWSIIVMVLDVVIIYALTIHGGEAKIAAEERR